MYIIYPTRQQALDRSNQMAISKGCQPPTNYWWPVYGHSTDTTAAIDLLSSTEGLTPAEIAARVTDLPGDPAGWLNNDGDLILIS